MRTGRWTVLAVAAAVAAWVVCVVVVVRSYDPGLVDLRVYRAGGSAWLHDLPLYDPRFPWSAEHPQLPFTYPPIAAVLFALLAVLPWWIAVGVLLGASVAGLALTCVLAARRAVERPAADGSARTRGAVAVLAAAAVAAAPLFEPIRDTVSFGQVNLVLMAVVAADCLLRRTPWPRGALIGVAAAVKLTPFAFLLFFVARREWRPVVASVVAFVAVSLLGWALAPGDTRGYWLGVLPDSARIGTPDYAGNQALHGTIARLGMPEAVTTAAWLASAAVVGVLALVAVARLRSGGDALGALVVTAAAALLASPVSWSHHWVWVVPALVWLACRAWVRRSTPLALAGVAVAAVFTWAPHWSLPYRDGAELGWSPWQHVVGNAYVWIGLAVVICAFVTSRPRPPSGAVSGGAASGSRSA